MKAFDTGNFPILGWCVHFSVSDFVLPLTTVQGVLGECGINENKVRKAQLRTVVRRTTKKLSQQRGNAFHRKLVESNGVSVFGVVAQDEDTAHMDADFHTATKVGYNPVTKEIAVDGENSAEAKKLISQLADSTVGDSFRTLAKNFLVEECSAVRVRNEGGIWFVPVAQRLNLEKLVLVFDKLSKVSGVTTCYIGLIPIVDVESAKESVGRSTLEDLKSNIKQFEYDLTLLDDNITDKVAQNRFKEYDDLRAKIELYKQLLNINSEELEKKLVDLEIIVKSRVLRVV